MKKIKLGIASGKGGVGKSMLASTLAIFFGKNKKIVAVDCDVDAPNLAIWLGEPENWKKTKKISVSEKPIIDNSKLTLKQAQQCAKKCRFNALMVKKGRLRLNPFLCEGCGACEIFCPQGAVKMKMVKNGEIRTKKTKYKFPLVAGRLYPGETGSGKIVTEIKKEADKFDYDIQIIDSAPGTGCPVTAALRDVNFAVLITEPTPSAFYDLKRVLKVVNYFNIPWKLVINKWDINKSLARNIEKQFKGRVLGKISYDKKILVAVGQLKPIVKTNLKAKKEIERIYNKLIKKIAEIRN
jgi:MinD superfamily P-loop ATPase